MKKKGLLAMGLAGVLTVGMCMPVLAASDMTVTETSQTKVGSTEIGYDIAEEYSVVIPAKLELDQQSKVLGFTVTGNINESKQLKITMAGISQGGIKLTAGKQEVLVPVKLSGTELSQDGVVATFQQGDTVGSLKNAKGDLTIEKPANQGWAGNYTGTATFTVDLEPTVGP